MCRKQRTVVYFYSETTYGIFFFGNFHDKIKAYSGESSNERNFFMDTVGKRIAESRKAKNINQNELAEMLSVSPQAVSKWENDISCPDISLLPSLAKTLGMSIDELLCGKQEPAVSFVPEDQRKDISKMMLRIVVNSSEGDKVRVNIPCSLAKLALDCGMDLPQVSGNDSLNSAFKSIDLGKILEMVEKGAVGNLVEVETHEGDVVNIFVE